MGGDCGPNLILMAGYPGVGKSAISVELAAALGYPLLDVDDILTEVDALSGIKDWELKGRISYCILKTQVARQIQLGVSVVVDTPMTHQWLRDFMFKLADTHNAMVHIIYCHCSDGIAIERNRSRLAQDPDRYTGRDTDNFHRIKGLFQPVDHIASIRVDTERPVTNSIASILEYMEPFRGEMMAQPVI
jgi:predicted kinase